MTVGETLLLFGKLRDDETDVLCLGEIFGVAFMIRGKVTRAEDGVVDIVSDEASFRISLLADGLVFGYKEPRDFPEFAAGLSEEQRTAIALTIEFPDRGLVVRPERVIVIEVLSAKGCKLFDNPCSGPSVDMSVLQRPGLAAGLFYL